MERKGPVLTLLAGLGTAAVLLGLSINAAGSDATANQRNAAGSATPPAASPSPTESPTESPSAEPTPPAENIEAKYAGRVDGAKATVAIAVKNGQGVAYLCDGKKVEAWLKGTAADGKLDLSGAGGASLTGTFEAAKAAGTVAAGGKTWTFNVATAKPPGGLYRAATRVANAQVVGGWIVLPDGTQVGILTKDGEPQPAPKLDTSTGAATVDGTTVTAKPVDGTQF